MEDLRTKVSSIDEISARFTLAEYMRQCRDHYRVCCDAVRAAAVEGRASAMETILQNSAGSSKTEGDDCFNVPEKLLKIYSPAQISQPDDLHLDPIKFKRIKNYIKKQYPSHSKDTKECLDEIQRFRSVNHLQDVLYSSNFVFVPADALMDVLVLKTAL